MPRVILALALMALTGSAGAEIYKCQSGDGGTVYSDAPCKTGTQTITDIPVAIPDDSPGDGAPSALTRQMDIAVKSAIATDNLQRAQALATTRDHWEWIAEAKRQANQAQAPARGRTEADFSAERIDTQACEQATRSYELEANSSFDEPEALAARRSIMRAACGIREPVEVNNYQAPVPIVYPRLHPGFNRPGYGYSRHPRWGHKPPRNPVKAEPPAVSVIVGPAGK